MKELFKKQFNKEAKEVKKLNGYDNENFLVKTNSGNYVFKTYMYSEELFDLVEAENTTLLFLQEEKQTGVPIPVPFTDGSFIKILNIANRKCICRMLTFLEGTFMANINPSEAVYSSLGSFLAQLDVRLQKFKNYTLKARQWEWDIQYLDLNLKYIEDIADTKDRSIVRYFFKQFEENVKPILANLPKSIIHNDANEWNILANDNQVTGIIDFGDLAYSFRINELAVAITYACYDKNNGLECALPILKSYHNISPISEEELSVLYYLIAARLCISVCNSAHTKKLNPDNEYASVSENSAWKMLHYLISVNPVFATNSFKSALGYEVKSPSEIDKVVRSRQQHISPILSISYDQPIYMVRSAFQYMYDAYGNSFLDAYNNIPHVGHSHPKVVEAGQKQMAKLNTNTRYLYDQLAAYADKLLSTFPSKLNKVYFVNSGSAASDLAIRMARQYTRKEKLMVMEHGYHGNTQIGIDISHYKYNNAKGQGQKDNILKTPIPDVYRGEHILNDGSAGKLYGEYTINQIENSPSSIAAFISEPVVGCGGQVPLAKGYLKEVYPAVRRQGGLCISDEVQTGFGRLGNHFWGFEEQEVIPDMVIIGKPMANGHPMGAVVTTDEVAASFDKGVEFFSSFGGNPVSCAIALSVLEVIEEEKLQENAKEVGAYYKLLLSELKLKYNCIGDVRGSGLFLGVDLVKENSKDPDTKLAQYIKNELRNKHILISTDGPYDNVLKTKPPLIFNKDNAKTVVAAIDDILKAY